MALEIVASERYGPPGTEAITEFTRFDLVQPGDLMVFGVAGLTAPVLDGRFTWVTNYSIAKRFALGYWVVPDDEPVDDSPMYFNAKDYHPRGMCEVGYAIFRGIENVGVEHITDSELVTPKKPIPILYQIIVPEVKAKAAVALFHTESWGYVPGDVVADPVWYHEGRITGRINIAIYLWRSASGGYETISASGFRSEGSNGGRLIGICIPIEPKPEPPPPGESNVVRQWPRDDAQGVSSSPRIWPASKSARMAGGYPGGAGA